MTRKQAQDIIEFIAYFHLNKQLAILFIFLRRRNVFNKDFKREWWVEPLLLESKLKFKFLFAGSLYESVWVYEGGDISFILLIYWDCV